VIHLDTSLLVDFLKETGRDAPGPATAFLQAVGEEELPSAYTWRASSRPARSDPSDPSVSGNACAASATG
jgi:hypothetical protein